MDKITLVKEFLMSEAISFSEETDMTILMKRSNGKINPVNAVGIRPTGSDVILFNIYDAVKWVESQGLKMCL
jgi:hypothetical protein